MAGGDVSLEIWADALPILPRALEYAGDYLTTAAGQRNRLNAGEKCDIAALPHALQELVFDPQTSCGLLIAVNKNQADSLLGLIQNDDPMAARIGCVVPRNTYTINFIKCMG